MRADANELWLAANQRYLAAELARVRGLLEVAIGGNAVAPASDAMQDMPEPAPSIERLAQACGLSPFERDVVLLAAGAEMDSRIAQLAGQAQGLAHPTAASFSLALAALPGAHWSALHPNAALRRFSLLRVGSGELVTTSPLRIEERVLHYLAGIDVMDARLQGRVSEVEGEPVLSDSQAALAHAQPARHTLLVGATSQSRRAVAHAMARGLQQRLFAMQGADLPADALEWAEFRALWQREVALSGAVLLLELEDALDRQQAARLLTFITQSNGLVLVSADESPAALPSLLTQVEVPAPNRDELRALRRESAGPLNADGWARLVEHFPMDTGHAAQLLRTGEDEHALWQSVRLNSRRAMEGLAQRIEPRANWDDLVLPETTLRVLRDVARHVRLRHRVHGDWGFEARSSRGLGVSALFAGPSGVGKTMSAEVIAAELALDLYRIDLSAVVSKYIGETEKNLRRIFNAAEQAGAILLFDEADALFGKRSEVKDSHDRYANVEVSYLLQRMESYRGLAILTTNMRQSLDDAFLRRIRFMVNFAFPSARERAEIWRKVFPAATPLGELDFTRLSKLAISGGHIRNIALGAAFIAAEQGSAVQMAHIVEAARSEYAKLERPLSDVELGVAA